MNSIELSNEINSAILTEVSSNKEVYGNLKFRGCKIDLNSIKMSYSNGNCTLILIISLHHADMPYPLYFNFYDQNLGQSVFSFENINLEPSYHDKLIIQDFLSKSNPDYVSIRDWLINELRTIPPEIWKIKPKFDDKG